MTVLRGDVGEYAVGALEPDPESAPFWEAARGGAFVVQRCESCGRRQYPPLPYCRRCHGDSLTWVSAPSTGTLYSWAVVRHPLVRRHETLVPFAAGIVELEPDVRVVALLDIEHEELAAGLQVALSMRPLADGGVIVGEKA